MIAEYITYYTTRICSIESQDLLLDSEKSLREHCKSESLVGI